MRNETVRKAASGGPTGGRGSSRTSTTAVFAGAAAAVAMLAVSWLLGKVLLVLAAGVLAAVVLSACVDWLEAHGIRDRRVAVLAIGAAGAAVFCTTGWLLAPEISAQIDQLVQRLPRAWQDLLAGLRRWEWGRALTEPPQAGDSLALVGNATGVFTAILRTIAELAIVVLLGLYVAANPAPYQRGLLKLMPRPRRERAIEVALVLARTLRRWMLSRLVAMVLVGLASALGLSLLGVELALTLGLLSGVLTFVPYLGAIVSGAPAVLLGLAQGGWTLGLEVLLLYVVVHLVEGYLVTPLVEQQAVWLPPGVSVAAQVVLGTLAGTWGLALASPIAATILVVVNMLYIEDHLGERAAVPTSPEAAPD